MMFVINSYKPKSKSARRLAKALKGKVVCCKTGDDKVINGLMRNLPKGLSDDDVVINWGNGGSPEWYNSLNKSSKVQLVANKRTAFDALLSAGVPIPRYARDKASVTWKGTTVVRKKLTGHSGEGIEIHESSEGLPEAPLYVEYIKKEQEFRIHVGRRLGTTVVIAVQRKARNKSVADGDVDWQVRSHANGFVFARESANPDDSVLAAACDALGATGLDFGAVDIIWNTKERKAYVLEINTAPGLEGQTIEDYAAFFRSLEP